MYKNLLRILFVACVFMLPALYNGYIIPSADAATYIEAGMENTFPADRPVFYGWFIKLCSLGISLWIPAFVQCVLLAIAVIDFVKQLLPRVGIAVISSISLLLAIGTSAGWFTGQLMPDILTPLLLLALVNYIYAEHKNKKVYYLSVLLFAAICHNSHLIILSFCVIVLLGMSVLGYFISIKQALKTAVVSIAAWLIVCVPNYFLFNRFVPTVYSHVFLMGKLVENGMARIYLQNECGQKNLEYCRYKEQLKGPAWEFVWGAESPMQQLGGWDASAAENKRIIKGVLTTPAYYPRLLFVMLRDTWLQLTQVEIDRNYELPWFVYDAETPFYKVVNRHFGGEIKQLQNCRVNKHTIDTAMLSNAYLVVIVLSTIAALLSFRYADKEVRRVYIAVLVFLVINAFVTANFANVLSRLNARAIWLLPFMNFIAIISAWQVYRSGRRSVEAA